MPEFHPESSALIKQYLTLDLFKQLSPLKTATGFTLEAAIKSGLKNQDSSIGIYAGDAESYSLFARILNPIIHAYHDIEENFIHKPDLSPVSLSTLDPDNDYILSTRIRVARNINKFPFPCHINSQDRRQVETLVSSAIQNIPQDLAGKFIPFQNLDSFQMQDLLNQKLAFKKGDRFQDAAGVNRNFPESRGIFLSQDKKFRIWVNEEDHLRIISMESSSDISSVFNRLIFGLEYLSSHLGFAFDKKYGFLTSCPTNIGTAMRAGVHICLAKLEKNQDILKNLAKKYQLQIRGTKGEKTKVDKAIFDISNKQRLGLSEIQIIKNLHTGIAAIIEAEKNL
ncbi:MAG: phosphagen kinase [Desulfobacula sp.]|jgi:protein-arginine kinase|nr:phosphagen kinase [Desulfobacula sp.]